MDYFKDITGYSEHNAKNKLLLEQHPKHKHNHLLNNFTCGCVHTDTLQDIIESFKEELKSNNSMNNNMIQIKCIQGDIRHLQGLKENENSLFQIASNFNVLENAHRYDKFIPYQNFLTKYIDDPTQGTFGAVSAGPGTIYRTYIHPKINLLRKYSNWFEVSNGKLVRTNMKQIPSVMPDYLDQIQVCTHESTQVTHTLDNTEKKNGDWKFIKQNGPIIHQSFVSTMAFSKEDLIPEHMKRIVKCLLVSAYMSTFASAFKINAKKIYLTLIGGGVFHNPHDMIIDAIHYAIRFWKPLLIKRNVPIYIVYYNERDKKSIENISFETISFEKVE